MGWKPPGYGENMSLRQKIIRLAYKRPDLRGDLLPILKKAMVPPPPPLGGREFGPGPSWAALPEIVPRQLQETFQVGDWVRSNDVRLQNTLLVVSEVNTAPKFPGRIRNIGVRAVDPDTGNLGQVFVGKPAKFTKTRKPHLSSAVESEIRRELASRSPYKRLYLANERWGGSD